MSVEVVVPAPSLCCDTDACSCASRCWRLQACCLPRLAIINAWSPCPHPHGCHAIETQADAEQDNRRATFPPLAQATPLSPRPAHRRHQAIDPSLAQDTVEDLCQHLAGAQRWRDTWRERYEAPNPAWPQARSPRPQHSPTRTPAHVPRALGSLHVT
jgi:hypothetical protein